MPFRPQISLALHLFLPLLLIWPVAKTTAGAEVFFLSGIYNFIMIVCAVRIVWLLRRREHRVPAQYRKTIGPALAIAIVLAANFYFGRMLAPVRDYTRTVAAQLQEQCHRLGRCPAAIEGWEPRHDAYSSMTHRGGRIKWPLLYWTDGKEFTVTIYLLLDSRIDCTGGVARELKC